MGCHTTVEFTVYVLSGGAETPPVTGRMKRRMNLMTLATHPVKWQFENLCPLDFCLVLQTLGSLRMWCSPSAAMRNISFPDIWHTKGRLFCYYNLSTGLANRLISIKFLHLAIKKALLSKPVLWALRERFLVLKKACEDGGMSWAGDLKDHLMETL